MWNSSISTFNKTGLKGHLHHPWADTTKGQSGVFLLVEVGGVDDIAVDLFISRDAMMACIDLFISRDDGLQKHNVTEVISECIRQQR